MKVLDFTLQDFRRGSLGRTKSNSPLCRYGSPDKEEKNNHYRGHQQSAEPTFELEVHQPGQCTADERPRYADQKISKQANDRSRLLSQRSSLRGCR
jgi:hypothetical protein